MTSHKTYKLGFEKGFKRSNRLCELYLLGWVVPKSRSPDGKDSVTLRFKPRVLFCYFTKNNRSSRCNYLESYSKMSVSSVLSWWLSNSRDSFRMNVCEGLCAFAWRHRFAIIRGGFKIIYESRRCLTSAAQVNLLKPICGREIRWRYCYLYHLKKFCA